MAGSRATCSPIRRWTAGSAAWPSRPTAARSSAAARATEQGTATRHFSPTGTCWTATVPCRCKLRRAVGVALAFSPDGRQMAVGESSPPQSTVKSRVRIWSLDPPRVLATVPKLVGSVYSVAYSQRRPLARHRHGRRGRARCPARCMIVEPSTGALRQKLPDLPGKVEAMFTADSRFLITVNASKKRPAEIRIWNPQTGQLAAQIDNADRAGRPDYNRALARRPLPGDRPRRSGQSGRPPARPRSRSGTSPRRSSSASSLPRTRRPSRAWRSRAAACSWLPATWRAMSAFGTLPRDAFCPSKSHRRMASRTRRSRR